MLSQWHTCPQDILQRCFSNQLDYSDNAAAACACKPWQEAFISACRASTLMYGGVRTDASPSYLRQLTALTSLTLVDLPIWDTAQSRLYVARRPLQQWSETLGAVSATCKQLTLDHFLPRPVHILETVQGTLDVYGNAFYQTFSQLSLLQHLTLYGSPAKTIPIEALSGLLGLQTLQVCGEVASRTLRVAGSLSSLPSSITRLSMHACGGFPAYKHPSLLQLEDLAHLQRLQHLDLDSVNACFCRVALSRLPLLTKLDLQYMYHFVSLRDDILPLTRLRELCLRYVANPDSVLPLCSLLLSLSSLQKLDILECPGVVTITPDDCQHLQMRSICIQADMLTNLTESSFDDFLLMVQTHDLVSKPTLRIDVRFPRFCLQDAVIPKLFYAVTHLTLLEAPMWPAVFGLHGVELPLLRVLDVRFDELVQAYDESAVVLSPQLNLTELYIADSRNLSFDLANCTSLRSIGITHRGPNKPALGLPPFLTRLCLYNVLSASLDIQLHDLQDLSSIKLGGKTTSTDVTRQLPPLPQSVIELDLWDGLLTDLQQLSRLTNLIKLFMPDPPNVQQLQTIRQLRRLRHVELTRDKDWCPAHCWPDAPWRWL